MDLKRLVFAMLLMQQKGGYRWNGKNLMTYYTA